MTALLTPGVTVADFDVFAHLNWLCQNHSIQEAIFLSDRVIVLSSRPSKVDNIFTIDLPRPRSLDMRYTDAFGHYNEEIHKRITQAQRSP